MKVYLIAIACVLIFTSFYLFSVSSDRYVIHQEEIKMVANDAAHAAALYYEPEAYSLGEKIYDKGTGNQVIDRILSEGLSESPVTVYTYYFDQDGTMTTYKNKVQTGSEKVTFPYEFRETLTAYQKTVAYPTVIVTLEMPKQRFLVPWVEDPQLIRTSGYEYREPK